MAARCKEMLIEKAKATYVCTYKRVLRKCTRILLKNERTFSFQKLLQNKKEELSRRDSCLGRLDLGLFRTDS